MPALDPYMQMSPSTDASLDGPPSPPGGEMVGGAPPEPLLDFKMHPVGPRRNWRDVPHKQRYQARIQKHREANPTDDLGREATEALRRTIHRQIKADSSLKPHHTLHFTMQSDAFTYAFPLTTFTVSEFEEGSDRLDRRSLRHVPTSPGIQTQFQSSLRSRRLVHGGDHVYSYPCPW